MVVWYDSMMTNTVGRAGVNRTLTWVHCMSIWRAKSFLPRQHASKGAIKRDPCIRLNSSRLYIRQKNSLKERLPWRIGGQSFLQTIPGNIEPQYCYLGTCFTAQTGRTYCMYTVLYTFTWPCKVNTLCLKPPVHHYSLHFGCYHWVGSPVPSLPTPSPWNGRNAFYPVFI